jgi:hypothetical protein
MTEIQVTADTPLFQRLRPMIFALWVVALARLAVDFREVDAPIVGQTGFIQWTADWISVSYLVIPLLLVFALRGLFRGWTWGRCMKGLALVAVLCWAIPNSVAYTTGQLKGWQHGRYRGQNLAVVDGKEVTFEEDAGPPPGATDVRTARTAPLGETTAEKLTRGMGIGLVTFLPGFIWMFIWFHVLVYLPRRLGAKV